MNVSVIICSYGRPERLPACLSSVDAEVALYQGSEIVLVYSADDISTAEAMNDFARTALASVKVVRARKRGLSVARNTGIANAGGDVLVFTDDDCLMSPGYIAEIIGAMEENQRCGYGGGGVQDAVLFGDGVTHIKEKAIVEPRMLVGAGVFNGNNMFFRKSVFDTLGGFREDMGASSGTSFCGAEDLEMTTRANFAGFSGVLLPSAVIIHDHQREPNSKEMLDCDYTYSVARGSFYAYMLIRGIHEIWQFWALHWPPDSNRKLDKGLLRRLQREFYGASEYLDYCLKTNIDL